MRSPLLFSRPKIIITLKYYLYTTRRGLPIYYNFPLVVDYLPPSWSMFAKMLRKARYIAERKLFHRLGRRVKGNLEFYVVKRKTRSNKGEFVAIFPSIIVDPFGNIVKVSAPRKEYPYAYRLYLDYLRDKYVKTGDKKWWYKYLGVSTNPNYWEKRLEYIRRMREAKGKISKPLDPLKADDKSFKCWLDKALNEDWLPFEVRSWLDNVLRGGSIDEF